MTTEPPGYADRPLSGEQLRDALAASLGVDPSGLALLSARESAVALARLRSLHERIRVLDERASIDDLTGVFRRGAGMAALTREIDRARRTQGRLVLAFLDVDGLKQVNDTLGHAAGDRLLMEVAWALRTRLRSYDLVMRYGGDEFVCVLFGAELEGADRRLDAVASEIARATGGRSVTWGLVELGADDTAEALVARADLALYERRQGGGDRPGPEAPAGGEGGTADDGAAGAP